MEAVDIRSGLPLQRAQSEGLKNATTIEYALPASGPVRLSVYDILGREVAILVDGVQHTGKHTSVFDGTSLPSGTYLYRLEATGQVRTGLMTLMK